MLMGDLKNIHMVLGLSGPASGYPCPYCVCPKGSLNHALLSIHPWKDWDSVGNRFSKHLVPNTMHRIGCI